LTKIITRATTLLQKISFILGISSGAANLKETF
jgi:hypothetical protein